MKTTNHPHQINHELFRCIDQIGQLSIAAVIGIDQLAASLDEPGDLVFCDELASSLELMESQLNYYFPKEDREFDPAEWADALAVLNSGADYIEDQATELEYRFDAVPLSETLFALSLHFVEAIPYLIAARIASEGRDQTDRPKADWQVADAPGRAAEFAY